MPTINDAAEAIGRLLGLGETEALQLATTYARQLGALPDNGRAKGQWYGYHPPVGAAPTVDIDEQTYRHIVAAAEAGAVTTDKV